MLADGFTGNSSGRFRFDGPGAGRTGRHGQSRKEKLKVVVDFGDGTDRRTGGFDIVRLFDGDGRRYSLDRIDPRLVHAVEELAGVGRERLDVATLPFCIDCVEGEGRFPRTTGTGDDMEQPAWEIQIHPAKVVLAGPTDSEDRLLVGGVLTRRHAGLIATGQSWQRTDQDREISG